MIKALIADDDSSTAYLLKGLLVKWGFEVVVVKDGFEALEVMQGEDPPRLLLLDWEMPRLGGLEVCQQLRWREPMNPPYIIFLTLNRNSENMALAFEAGASDYVAKPCSWNELRVRVRVGERTLKLQDQLNAAHREMRELAMRDMLTGIYNRRAISERLYEELARFERGGGNVNLALVDLDNFKRVNDTWGHQAGDMVLREFAKTVRKEMRASDVVGRWGGDEFMILALDLERESAGILFERIRKLATEMKVPFQKDEIAFTVSIGVAGAVPGESADELLHRADLALFAVKANGRNASAFALSPAAEFASLDG